MSATKVRAEALEILTAPGAPCDPFAGSVKDPDVMLRIIKDSFDIFVSQNPQPSGQPPEELGDAFLRHLDERKRADKGPLPGGVGTATGTRRAGRG